MSQLANRNLETQLEFQISPTYSKPPSAERRKKKCEKTCLELPSAREYSTISRDGFIGYIIHCGLFAQI